MSETAERIIEKAYSLIQEDDELISITERGLKQAITEEVERLKKRVEDYRRLLQDAKLILIGHYGIDGHEIIKEIKAALKDQ